MSSHRCDKCGKRAVARANGRFWLCGECVEKAAVASLSLGEPLIQAVQGEPRYLIIPTGVGHRNN